MAGLHTLELNFNPNLAALPTGPYRQSLRRLDLARGYQELERQTMCVHRRGACNVLHLWPHCPPCLALPALPHGIYPPCSDTTHDLKTLAPFCLALQAIVVALPGLQELLLLESEVLPECIGGLTTLTRLATCPRQNPDNPRALPASLIRLRQLQKFEVECDADDDLLAAPPSVRRLELLAELPALRTVSMSGAFFENLDWAQASAGRLASLRAGRSAVLLSWHTRPACSTHSNGSRQQHF